jgi:hypothetical protein
VGSKRVRSGDTPDAVRVWNSVLGWLNDGPGRTSTAIRFLINTLVGDQTPTPITVVLNRQSGVSR